MYPPDSDTCILAHCDAVGWEETISSTYECLLEAVGWVEQRDTQHQTPVLDILQHQAGTNYDQQEKCKTAHIGVAQRRRITFSDPGKQRHHWDAED